MAPRILPGQAFVTDFCSTLDGEPWAAPSSATSPLLQFHLLIIYRGVQCSHCKKQLIEFESRIGEFSQRNVSVFAASADTQQRALQAASEWNLKQLRLGYSLELGAIQRAGAFISQANKPTEMPQFSEPAVFLIKPDLTLFAAWISSFPFARPKVDDLLQCIDFVVENSILPRGTAHSPN